MKLVETDLVAIDDVLRKIGTNTMYIFGLSKDWILNLLAAIIVVIQVSVLIFFLSAAIFKANVESDWRYTWECPIDQLNCVQDKEGNRVPMLIAMFVVIIFTGQDFFAGSWTMS